MRCSIRPRLGPRKEDRASISPELKIMRTLMMKGSLSVRTLLYSPHWMLFPLSSSFLPALTFSLSPSHPPLLGCFSFTDDKGIVLCLAGIGRNRKLGEENHPFGNSFLRFPFGFPHSLPFPFPCLFKTKVSPSPLLPTLSPSLPFARPRVPSCMTLTLDPRNANGIPNVESFCNWHCSDRSGFYEAFQLCKERI